MSDFLAGKLKKAEVVAQEQDMTLNREATPEVSVSASAEGISTDVMNDDDGDDVVVDVDNFNTREYFWYLMDTSKDLEDKDFFPYWTMFFTLMFVVCQIQRYVRKEYFLGEYLQKKDKEVKKPSGVQLFGMGEKPLSKFDEAKLDSTIKKIVQR